MPAGFTRAFAARLDTVCRMRVVEAAGSEPLERGVAYIAPGDYHLTVERQGLRLLTRLDQKPSIHYQRPAVDALFASLAAVRGLPIVGMLLTGMGADGADGMVALRAAGAETIAEAEESCVVFGMPKEAIARGGAVHVASLLAIPDLVFECLSRLDRATRAS
jgi:two-component system chemotaxis response regulator CheB